MPIRSAQTSLSGVKHRNKYDRIPDSECIQRGTIDISYNASQTSLPGSVSFPTSSIPLVRPDSPIPQTRTSYLTPAHPPHCPEQPLPPPVSSPQKPASSGNNPCGAHIRTFSSLAIYPLVRRRPRWKSRWRRGRVWLWSASRRLSGSLGRGEGCKGRS